MISLSEPKGVCSFLQKSAELDKYQPLINNYSFNNLYAFDQLFFIVPVLVHRSINSIVSLLLTVYSRYFARSSQEHV